MMTTPRRTSEEANYQRLYWINQILPYVNYIEFLQYKSILEIKFPVKLLYNDCIVKKKNAIQIILNWINLEYNI